MSRLRNWLERLEDVGTAWANHVVDRWPALWPLIVAIFIVGVLRLDGGRVLPGRRTLLSDLAIGGFFFIIIYTELRMRREESSWYGKKVRAIDRWRRDNPESSRAVGIALIGLMLTMVIGYVAYTLA